MQPVTTIGLDIANAVFQVCGIDAEGKTAGIRNSSRIAERASNRRPVIGSETMKLADIVHRHM